MSDSDRYEDSIQQHFPITVLERRYRDTGGLNEKLFTWLKEQARDYGDSADNAVNSGKISTVGGYQTPRQVNIFQIKRPEIRTLHDRYVAPAALRYLQAVFGEEARTFRPVIIGWSNLLGPGDWQKPHVHPTEANLASGVYYVKTPPVTPPAGCIEFINPHPESIHHGFHTTRTIVPEEGLMVLFPPFYFHFVHPFRGEGERAIVAFDVLARRESFSIVG